MINFPISVGKHWQDKSVADRSKRRLLQSISHQFPCAKLLKLWGLRDKDECRLCKRFHPEVTPWLESLGHIQARCPALQKPIIAVHHGIWRELLSIEHIRKVHLRHGHQQLVYTLRRDHKPTTHKWMYYPHTSTEILFKVLLKD